MFDACCLSKVRFDDVWLASSYRLVKDDREDGFHEITSYINNNDWTRNQYGYYHYVMSGYRIGAIYQFDKHCMQDFAYPKLVKYDDVDLEESKKLLKNAYINLVMKIT